jgi:hypothetical protein
LGVCFKCKLNYCDKCFYIPVPETRPRFTIGIRICSFCIFRTSDYCLAEIECCSRKYIETTHPSLLSDFEEFVSKYQNANEKERDLMNTVFYINGLSQKAETEEVNEKKLEVIIEDKLECSIIETIKKPKKSSGTGKLDAYYLHLGDNEYETL